MNWIKVYNSLRDNPKIVMVSSDAFKLYICGLCYCNEHLTDGAIAKPLLPIVAPGLKRHVAAARELVDAGLWRATDDGWQIHDYTEVQRSAAQVKEIRRKDRTRKTTDSDRSTHTDSARIPDGIQTDANGIPDSLARSQEKRREEKTPKPPDPDFEEWLLDHQRVTGHEPPKPGTKARQALAEAFNARVTEGYTVADLIDATLGARSDEYRRQNGYDVAESVLRPRKVADLVAKGRMRRKNSPASATDALAASFGSGS